MNGNFSRYKGSSSLFRAFADAFRGIRVVVSGQRNFRIHLGITVIVVAMGFATGINHTEWILLLLTIGLVLALEAINTALEMLVDLVSPEFHPLAGKVKDIAAGAVLLAALVAILTGLIIFVPKIKPIFI